MTNNWCGSVKYGLARCWDTHAVLSPGQCVFTGSGHAAGTCTKWDLAPFQGGQNKNRSPDVPNGFADVPFGWQGLTELPRAQ